MKIRRLSAGTTGCEKTARLLRDQDRRCIVLIGGRAFLASDRALAAFEVTSVSKEEKAALMRAQTRLRNLRWLSVGRAAPAPRSSSDAP